MLDISRTFATTIAERNPKQPRKFAVKPSLRHKALQDPEPDKAL
jgi:hypothetical protein